MRSVTRRAFILGSASVCASVALAQSEPLRTVPDDARRAKMSFVQGMEVAVDGRRTTLAPGALVRDTQNLVIVPALIPSDATVAYQVDINGQIHRVWVLTAQEAARHPAKR